MVVTQFEWHRPLMRPVWLYDIFKRFFKKACNHCRIRNLRSDRAAATLQNVPYQRALTPQSNLIKIDQSDLPPSILKQSRTMQVRRWRQGTGITFEKRQWSKALLVMLVQVTFLKFDVTVTGDGEQTFQQVGHRIASSLIKTAILLTSLEQFHIQ